MKIPIPTAYAPEEVRQQFYRHLRMRCAIWAESEAERGRMESLCFSILNIFDGTSSGMPALDIHLAPHESDKAYHIDNCERWYEPGMVINNCMMHEEWYPKST